MSIPKEEMELVNDISLRVANYAEKKNDFGIMVRIAVSQIMANIEYFSSVYDFAELLKISLQVTALYDEINEIEFPDNILKEVAK